MEEKHHPDNDQSNDGWPSDGWQVVLDADGHFSVWPQDRLVPKGWKANGYAGSRDACLAEISRIWSDPRPLSLQTAMASGANF